MSPGGERPDPDELLARVTEAEQRASRGRLKVFLGAAPGVGKTYAMLEATRDRVADGADVVVGWVQPHGRPETEALLAGLELLPPRSVTYHGVELEELDLDGALARRPALLVVDELAHTNAPGARHAKRWQDVVELLNAGIDVYTTVNIQHLESLNDVVAQITGVVVRETVPDWVVDRAEEVEVIDLPPDDLLQRLREGKVYVPDQAAGALQSFFRKGNLIALRELALRRTADRVDAQMRDYRRDHAIVQPWPAAERILVCISASALAPRLVRAAQRMAAGLHAEWIVANVERLGGTRQEDREAVYRALALAEELGAEVATLPGDNVAAEILRYAHGRNATRIVVGKPIHPRWRDRLFGSVLDEVVRGSGAIDVVVISGDPRTGPAPGTAVPLRRPQQRTLAAYAASLAQVLLCTLVSAVLPTLHQSNVVMVYLIGVVAVAALGHRGPAILSAVLSVLAFDFFFVEPRLTFSVSDTEYILTFAVMLVVGLVISSLTVRLRQRAQASQERELRTATLYAMSRDLAGTRGAQNLVEVAVRHVHEAFDGDVAVLLPRDGEDLAIVSEEPPGFAFDANEQGVARWVLRNGRPAGAGAATLPGASALYLPLNGAHGAVGVLALRPRAGSAGPGVEEQHLMEALANQTAVALERASLAEAAEASRVEVEGERLRTTLLSAVSHDLRSPLAGIMGSASTLLDGTHLDAVTRRELTESIYDEAHRLNRLVGNLLEMTRLQYGAVEVRKEWNALEELVGIALDRLTPLLVGRQVDVNLGTDLPLLPYDAVLLEQVMVNLLENALRYSPGDAPIEITATLEPDSFSVTVADRGPGLAPGDETRVFEAFYRAAEGTGPPGVGLGLPICAGIVKAHGGTISAENRPGGGAAFRFTLPRAAPPLVEEEAPSAEGAPSLRAAGRPAGVEPRDPS